jgi:hypothetical protein
VRTYSFLSQVVSFTEVGPERDYRFCRALASFIKRDMDDTLDLHEVATVTTDRRPQGARLGSRASPTDSSPFLIGLLSCPTLPHSQSGTLRRTPLPRRRARPVALPGCPDPPERPGARPGLDYLVAMAPSILLSIGFFVLSHQAGANWERSPGKLEDYFRRWQQLFPCAWCAGVTRK